MKIRTTKDVTKLDLRIKDELGIDIQKYKDEEVVESFVDLLVFPEYIISWVIRPILIALLLFVLGFFLLQLVHVEYVLYAIIGFVLFMSSGFFLGVLFLMWKMKKDIWGIVDYSLDIMKSALQDLNLMNNQIRKENRKEVLGLLFKGVIHIVTIPMLSKVISEKVPFVGGLINRVIKKVLTLISDQVKFDEIQVKQELEKTENEESSITSFTNSIDSVSSGLEQVTDFSFKVAQYPFRIVFVLVFLLLLGFLYLIN